MNKFLIIFNVTWSLNKLADILRKNEKHNIFWQNTALIKNEIFNWFTVMLYLSNNIGLLYHIFPHVWACQCVCVCVRERGTFCVQLIVSVKSYKISTNLKISSSISRYQSHHEILSHRDNSLRGCATVYQLKKTSQVKNDHSNNCFQVHLSRKKLFYRIEYWVNSIRQKIRFLQTREREGGISAAFLGFKSPTGSCSRKSRPFCKKQTNRLND